MVLTGDARDGNDQDPAHCGCQGGVAAHCAVHLVGHVEGRGREEGGGGRHAVMEKNPPTAMQSTEAASFLSLSSAVGLVGLDRHMLAI